MKAQRGVGLVEVLVALLLLSIAIFGFIALQIRAVAASSEAGKNIEATNLARDIAERIRVNRNGLNEYKAVSNPPDCSTKFCTSKEMAQYDFSQVKTQASLLGMDLEILDCQGSNFKRQCIYVAWELTTPTDGLASPHCTNGTAYVSDAKCIIMEIYNYD